MSQRLAVSMRRLTSEYGEVRDGLARHWGRFIQTTLPGRLWAPAPSLPEEGDMEKFLEGFGFDGLIFSGGEDWGLNPERDAAETAMFRWARGHNIPVLGVCRGAQVLNLLMGGGLSPVSGHRAVRHPVSTNGRRFEVNSYHNQGLTPGDLAPGLTPLALADDGSIEAFAISGAPVVGLLWHPEREDLVSDFDHQILFKLFGA